MYMVDGAQIREALLRLVTREIGWPRRMATR